MTSATTRDRAQEIITAVGGPSNVLSLTHCATRLRFELRDASVVDQQAVEGIPGVMGAVPQSGDRYQVVIGGAVQSEYTQIMHLPEMAGVGASRTAGSRGWTRCSSTCPTRSARCSACCSARP